MLKSLRDFNVLEKRVLVRCDFNVPLDSQGDISDDFRIKEALPTIKYLIENKAKVVLTSHLGDPQGKAILNLKLDKVGNRLEELLTVSIVKEDDCVGPEIESHTQNLKGGEILLLENLRFHKEEEAGDAEFAEKLSRLGDVYINDAFSVCHRPHASIIGVPKRLPGASGFLLLKELENLNRILHNPEKPMVAVIGGKKVETKSLFIDKISETADFVIVSGLIKKEIMEKNIKLGHPEKIIAPSDSLDGLDIDQKTAEIFCKKILQAKTVVWNGPFGRFEKEQYVKGTLAIAEAIIKSKAFSVVGGGETVEFLTKRNLVSKFSHVSTGGGAMLAYLSGEKMPGLEALEA